MGGDKNRSYYAAMLCHVLLTSRVLIVTGFVVLGVGGTLCGGKVRLGLSRHTPVP